MRIIPTQQTEFHRIPRSLQEPLQTLQSTLSQTVLSLNSHFRNGTQSMTSLQLFIMPLIPPRLWRDSISTRTMV